MSINISELIWTVICFFVLLVVLKKLLFDPLVSFMAARDARIQDGISAGRTAQQQLDAAAQARSDAQRRQSAAADALLAEAKSASERKRAQTLQAAHQETAQATRDVRARVRSEETAAAAAVDAKLPMHVIALNGAVTLVKPLGDVQEAHHLPQPTVHRITARLDEAQVQYAVFGVHEVVASDDMPLSRAQMVIGTFLNRAGGRTAFRNRKQGIDAVIQDCVKVVVFSQNLPLLDDLRAFVRDRCPDADVTSSWWDNIEIVPRSASKGSALQALAKSLNIPMDEVMVFGDSDNDLSMLKTAGVSVAMGNANERVRASARFETLTNDAQGVAAAIRAIVFGEDVPGVIRKR